MPLDGRRLVRALGLALALFLLVGGGIGFVAADGEEPGLQVPAARPGDLAVYAATEVIVDEPLLGEGPGAIALDTLVMEWLPERAVQDAGFRLRPAHPLRVEAIFAEGTPSEKRLVREFLFDAGTGEPLFRSQLESSSWCYSTLVGGHVAGQCFGASGASVDEALRTDRYEGVLGPCGASTTLHGRAYERGTMTALGACDWPGGLSRLTYRGTGWQDGPRGASYGFTSVEDPRLHLAFDETSPFPARVSAVLGDLFADPASTFGRYWDLERTAAVSGSGSYPPAGAPPDASDPIPLGEPTPWLLDDAGMGLRLPLRDAFTAALAQPATAEGQGSAGPWLARHPDSYLAFAMRLEFADRHGQANPAWALLWIDDGGDWLGKWVSDQPPGAEGVTLPELLGRGVTVADWQPEWLPDDEAGRLLYFPRSHQVPQALPRPDGLRERYEELHGAGTVNRYGFQVFCRASPCPEASVLTEVAHQEAPQEDALSRYVAGLATAHVVVERLSVDRDGRTAWRTEYVRTETGHLAAVAPGSSQAAPPPSRPDGAASLWAVPAAPAAATGISLVALLGGLLYYFWPTLKGLPVFGLFSRIRGDRVLEHPQRARLLEAIQAEPGVHFQELSRRLGVGHGVLEHHVRKLVDADLVVVRRSTGYTCYFPKATDRRMMDAAPMLRSGGSRAVLQAVAAKPGTSSRDLASHLGLAPSTVSYHLKRLETAGLVLPDVRAGVRLTPLGEQAKAAA